MPPTPTVTAEDPDVRRDARARLDHHLEERQRAVEAANAILEGANARAEGEQEFTSEELQSHSRATADILRHNEQVQVLRAHLGLVEPLASQIRYEDIPVGGSPLDVPSDQRGTPTAGADLTELERRAATAEYRQAFVAYLRRGMAGLNQDQRDLLEGVQRAQSSQDDQTGGYLVPTQLANRVIETAQTWNGVERAGATVVTTENGVEIQFPTASAVDEGEIIGENDEVTEDDEEFGLVAIRAYIFSSKMIRVPRSLLQDAGIDLDGYLSGRLGRRIGRRQGRAFTTGSGSSQPEGITVGATVGETAASATAVTYGELVDLKYSVDEAYRMNGRWMFHDTTLAAILKLVDGDSRPLINWDPRVGEPDTILGDPFTTNNHMPTMATGNKSVTYGDHSGYMIRRVRGVEILRLEERYAERHQIALLGFQRADGALLDTGAVKTLQQA
jgi:HK97 family phage major capsid protein